MSEQPTAQPPVWLTDTLWPGSSVSDAWWARSTTRFVAVPNRAAPTQLLAWTPQSAVAAAGRRSDDRSARRLLVDGVGVAGLLALAAVSSRRRLALRIGREVPLVDHLRDRLDPSIRSAIVLSGPPRANQKPVLQLVDRRGRTVAFAKVAWNPLTRELLDAEQRALSHLAEVGVAGATVPVVLDVGEFHGGWWMATSPATVARRRAATGASTAELARAIERTGPSWVGAAAASSFVHRLVSSASGCPLSGPMADRLVDDQGEMDLTLDPSHGDFVPWNILSGDPTTAVWDWERYDSATPTGFDRFHHAIQIAIHRRGRSVVDAGTELVAHAPDLVTELAPATAQAHARWYLADVMCRYERDGLTTGVAATSRLARDLALVLDPPRSST